MYVVSLPNMAGFALMTMPSQQLTSSACSSASTMLQRFSQCFRASFLCSVSSEGTENLVIGSFKKALYSASASSTNFFFSSFSKS